MWRGQTHPLIQFRIVRVQSHDRNFHWQSSMQKGPLSRERESTAAVMAFETWAAKACRTLTLHVLLLSPSPPTLHIWVGGCDDGQRINGEGGQLSVHEIRPS